jgi:hypothetical protein
VKTEPEEFFPGFNEKSEKFEDQKRRRHSTDSDFEWKLEEDSEFKVEEVKKVEKVEKEKKKPSDMLSDFEEEDNDSDFEPPKPKKKSNLNESNRPGPKKRRTKDEIRNIDEKIKKICGLKCHECNIDIDSYKELHLHFKNHHKDLEKYLICCYTKFIRRTRLLTHFKVKHNENPESHPCEFCGKTYKTEESLRLHKKNLHLNPKPKSTETFICQECGKVFSSINNLKSEF